MRNKLPKPKAACKKTPLSLGKIPKIQTWLLFQRLRVKPTVGLAERGNTGERTWFSQVASLGRWPCYLGGVGREIV
ncbi:hypothetical protein EON73_04785 [bacterium]|nr:MAG: hypothetical protein EON73_04785 [bacterium]